MAFEIENGVLKKYTEEQGVTEITIPDGVTEISSSTFKGCINLESINVSKTYTAFDFFKLHIQNGIKKTQMILSS
jgi:hypothetical protein